MEESSTKKPPRHTEEEYKRIQEAIHRLEQRGRTEEDIYKRLRQYVTSYQDEGQNQQQELKTDKSEAATAHEHETAETLALQSFLEQQRVAASHTETGNCSKTTEQIGDDATHWSAGLDQLSRYQRTLQKGLVEKIIPLLRKVNSYYYYHDNANTNQCDKLLLNMRRDSDILDPEDGPRSVRVQGYASESERLKSKDVQANKLYKNHFQLQKQRHEQFLGAILQHSQNFLFFHSQRRQKATSLAQNAQLLLEERRKEREKDTQKIERERLKALRNNDLNAYQDLLKETKNERLEYLLNKTDEYLSNLGALVASQQESNGGKEGSATTVDETSSAESGTEDTGSKDTINRYYHVAHRVKEPITVQPKMLMGGQLKQYQLEGLEWMVSLYNNNLNGILADEMGLGKTIQAVALLCYLMEVKNNKGPFLVCVPLSTMSNWYNEFCRWAPDIKVVKYKGTPNARKEIYRDQMQHGLYNVLLTTYEFAMKDKARLRATYWQYIIIDEGHRMKNARSKFSQILGQEYRSRNRLLLTGTPLQNSLPELWSLLNFLLPKIFNSVENFEEWFSKPFANFTSNTSASTDAPMSKEESLLVINRLHQVLRPFLLRRVKSQVLNQLPDKVEKVIRCELSAWQKNLV
eukprot:gb/GECG01010491.1/.p1 GENE.gb/GECG01010491.1/~~gb/GECG01010491.1/.p1  ORF type:complete len:634 (+),score=86.20 gb/GECG01010491.1/:1-1902(+)